MVVDKPGAGGNIGAQAAPDGHTLVMGTVGTHLDQLGAYSKMPYDMEKDFTPSRSLGTGPHRSS
ncbi:MAG: tripartite tricarboxylate transporter substrate-binding protein [Rubrivivax sp.]